uniref:Uncharacterized protein n=1 Tax=Anguilla anguilla TaxID=7936 RepID=A0A0E9QLA6_ANGAN
MFQFIHRKHFLKMVLSLIGRRVLMFLQRM